jgi:hypothetical protein
MTQRRDAITELVKQHVGDGRRWSVREFSRRAIDPESKWAPSKSLLGKIINDEGYKITPQLVGALAIGFDLPREVVAAAAHLQLIGYEEAELQGGAPAAIMRVLGVEPGGPERAVAERWAAEDAAS